MKILINTPSLSFIGGVSNHYLGLRTFWSENVKYNTVGKRGKKLGSGKYWLLWDILKFSIKLFTFKPNVVLLNPSLGDSALRRDFIFLNIAVFLGFKVAVLVHGFNLEYADNINKKWAIKNFNKATIIFVLSSRFKEIMQSWGVLSPICLTTTKVDDNLVKGFDIKINRNFDSRNILCLTRIEKAKGVYETIDVYAILKQKYNDLTLTFVGDGSELESLKAYAIKNKLLDVRFTGNLCGFDLRKEYQSANFFLFLSYGEGMPTVVLEAMAFGLPIFTRKVGGLADFFENGKMGYISDSLCALDFANAMVPYLENRELSQRVAFYNAQYAKAHFMASKVAKQLEDSIKKYLSC